MESSHTRELQCAAGMPTNRLHYRRCANCCCCMAFIFSSFFFWRSSIFTAAAWNWKALTLAAQLVRHRISSGLIPSYKHERGAERQL